MAVTDIFLRPGADVIVPGLSPSDILLFPNEADPSGEPGIIRGSGTVTSVASFDYSAAIVDSGGITSLAQPSYSAATADQGSLLSQALLDDDQQVVDTGPSDSGTVITSASFAAREQIAAGGVVVSVALLTATHSLTVLIRDGSILATVTAGTLRHKVIYLPLGHEVGYQAHAAFGVRPGPSSAQVTTEVRFYPGVRRA